MSQDPNQDPYSGYGSSPQNPYEAPSGNPYGVPPQNPYEVPPQNPYEVPPQNPYQVPQNPYGASTGYGDPNQGYGYAMPPSSPLPLGQALQQLPQQYIRVITKPSAMTFALEKGKAAWDIVWVQLVIYAVISAVLNFIINIISPNRFTPTGAGTAAVNPATVQAITAGTSIGSIVFVPLSFFISVGILYLIAKAFGGQGTFLEQSYTTLLWSVPLGILALVAELIPILGLLVAFALIIYGIVLNVFSIMAVHRLSGGKASAVVFIPVIVAILLACVLSFVIVAIFAAAMHQG